MISLLKVSIESVIKDTLWSFSNIFDLSDEATLDILNQNNDNSIINKCLSILQQNDKIELITPALRTLGNIASNKDD